MANLRVVLTSLRKEIGPPCERLLLLRNAESRWLKKLGRE
jgi:hypothetical protein